MSFGGRTSIAVFTIDFAPDDFWLRVNGAAGVDGFCGADTGVEGFTGEGRGEGAAFLGCTGDWGGGTCEGVVLFCCVGDGGGGAVLTGFAGVIGGAVFFFST